MRWAICLSLLICSTCLNRLYSQEAPFLFSRVGEEESWGNHSFNDIVQDKYGFVWFATYTGLFKYDGANITPYGLTPSLPKRLKSSRITSLLLDSKHRLWVGTTASGFFQYNYQDDSFTEFAVSGHIRAIVEGKEGVLYIGTDKGILQLNPEERKAINISKEKWAEEKLNPPQVNALRVDFDGSLWVGHSCGLSKIVWGENKNEVVTYPLNFSENTKDANLDCPCSVTSIKPSLVEKNVLWVGTARGLVKVKFEGDDPTRSTSSLIENTDASLSDKTFVIRIHIENAHQMWVGTNEGLKLIDPVTGSGKSYTSNSDNPYGLSNDKVHSLYKDKFNNLWVGTEKGVNKLNLRGSPFYKTAIFKNFARQYRLTGVVPSSHPNKAWVSTRGGGLYNYDFELDSIEKVRLEDYGDKQLGRFISALDQDNQQSIWLATLGGGIIRVFEEAFHEESRSALPTEIFSTKHGLATSHIMSIHASRDRNIWFSYWRKGLGRINSRTKEIGQYTVVGDPAIDLKEYHFTCFAENEENHLWVGTSENGLFKFSYKASEDSLYLLDYLQHQLNVPNSLSSNYINCLLLGENGDLWIGTETGLDVIRKGEEKITHILPNEDHKSIRVLSMLEENENLWLSSGDEIFKVARGEGPSKIVQYKDEKMVRNPFQVRAAIRSSSGKLLFGATGGFTLVNPGLIYEDISPPLVNLVSLKVKNKEVLIGEVNEKGRPMITSHISQLPTLDLTHKEDMLSIGFMGIHTAGKEKVSYAYKLDGFNKEWIYVDADDRVATYTNLPYKKLTFMVKARNASGIWSEPKSLTIKVQPPWWLSDWAYACYTLLAIGLLLAIWKIGRMRAEFQHSLELEKVENQKIKEVSRIKQEFYTHLSHELKTPLTLIITPLMKLLETPAETKELTYHHTMMYRNASKLLKMINQLLDIQKKEVGISGLKVTKGSLRKFIHEIYLSFIPLAEPLSIDYSFEANDGEEEVWFDPEELEKVVMNLLSNAFKFTPENGQIKVVVKKDKGKGSWCFSVEDNGVGIESDKLEYVFERFFHANEKSHRKLDKGSGIGLFLSKRIVEAHKGEISVESEAGVGTIFHVSLPVGNSHFTPEELIEDDMHASGMFEDERATALSSEAREGIGQLMPDNSFAEKPSLLVVDDNPDTRNYLKTQLSATYQVEEASNGEEACELAKRVVPDLVLADISMPIMDGLQLCHELKTDMVTSHIPVVLLTARSSYTYQFEGFQEGADAYMTKPFNFNLLEVRIKNLILSRKQLREKYSHQISFQPEKMEINSLDEEFLKQVKEAINNHFQETDFSVDQLAREVNMSRTQLYRKLKTLTGQSGKKLITDFRLKRAKDLLTANRYTVSEVSFMVGYNDIKSFRDQFKKAFKQNPRDFVSMTSESSA